LTQKKINIEVLKKLHLGSAETQCQDDPYWMGAVNFHGAQRRSADIDFWIETTEENRLH